MLARYTQKVYNWDMYKPLAVLSLVLVLAGCASSAKRLNRISLGMSKGSVIDTLGDPDSTKADAGVEVLEYQMSPDGFRVEPYWVFLTDGKVSRYGKAGDFGTSTGQVYTIQNR